MSHWFFPACLYTKQIESNSGDQCSQIDQYYKNIKSLNKEHIVSMIIELYVKVGIINILLTSNYKPIQARLNFIIYTAIYQT